MIPIMIKSPNQMQRWLLSLLTRMSPRLLAEIEAWGYQLRGDIERDECGRQLATFCIARANDDGDVIVDVRGATRRLVIIDSDECSTHDFTGPRQLSRLLATEFKRNLPIPLCG